MGTLLNRRRYMGGGYALPYDAEIKYLEADGTQYINTGYVPTGNDIKIKGKFMLLGYTGAYASWFGAYTDESTDSYRIIRNNTNNGSVIHTCGSKAGGSGNVSIAGLNNSYEFELSYNKLVINGNTVTTSNTQETVNARELVLWTNNTHSALTSGRFYYFQIYKNDVLVFDLIPVRVGQTGYMYDKVSGTLFGNDGTGSFILGGDKGTLPYDAEIEYLESTGTQWIDTGINLQYVVSMSAEMSISKTINTNSIVFGAYNDNSAPKFQIYINAQCKWSNSNASYYSYSGITSGASVSVNTQYTPVVTSKAAQGGNATILIFARNNDGGQKLPINGMRLYASQITSNGILVRDFIPVRVGQTGYLYDKVSDELFGNTGTGDFVLGNDKT